MPGMISEVRRAAYFLFTLSAGGLGNGVTILRADATDRIEQPRPIPILESVNVYGRYLETNLGWYPA